jgi:hypothetical protein
LLSIFGLGCLNGLGFLYVGIRARRPAWWIAGIVYLLAGWACFLFGTDGGEQETADDWLLVVLLAIWISSLAHACMINSSWLRWRAGYVPWYSRPPTSGYPGAGHPAAPAGSQSASGLPAGLVPPPQRYYRPGPPALAVPGPPGASGPVSPDVPGMGATPPPGPGTGTGAPGWPLDVNTAGPEQFASLPGFDAQRVRQVMVERQARRGFGDIEEFAAVANLAPHEFVRLRGLLACAPPEGPSSDPRPPTQGRILDV